MDSTSIPYWFQVGAWAANANGYGSDFGIPVTGASVQIRILNQILQHPDEELTYWVGVNLPNDAFIQVGYIIYGTDNGGAPSQFWEYFPPGTANENLGGFQGNVGSVVGSNGTWITFSLESLDTRWFAYVNNQTIGTANLQSPHTGTGPFAVAEVAGVQETDNILGPVEFRDLSYRDTNLSWHQAQAGVALCCYGATSNSLPLITPYPYGVESIPGDDNHWLAGSNLPKVDDGQHLWPWHHVTVSSTIGNVSGSGWYVQGSTIQLQATTPIPISQGEQYRLTGWNVNGNLTQGTSFTLDQDMTLTPIYTKQYLVTVTTPYGTPVGSGWYNAGTQTTVGVDSTTATYNGLLGQLGVKTSFTGFTRDYTGEPISNGQFTLTVDSPKTITASWSTNYGIMLPSILGIAVIATLSSILALRKRATGDKPTRSSAPIEKREPVSSMFCRYCRSEIPRDSTFCRECGAKLT